MDALFGIVFLPLGLGLLGFVEPCTVGSSLLFLQYVQSGTAREQVMQTLAFSVARSITMGLLGVLAAIVGALFVDYQKAAWAIMGGLYVALGAAYLSGRIDAVKRSFGMGLSRLKGASGAAAIGLVFAFNVPACAGPLLVALLGTAAVAQGGNAAQGFVMLAIFGLALSLPIAVAVFSERGRRLLDRLGAFSARAPRVIGILFLVLGVWSIRFALVAEVIP